MAVGAPGSRTTTGPPEALSLAGPPRRRMAHRTRGARHCQQPNGHDADSQQHSPGEVEFERRRSDAPLAERVTVMSLDGPSRRRRPWPSGRRDCTRPPYLDPVAHWTKRSLERLPGSAEGQGLVDEGASHRGWDGPMGDQPAVEERGGEHVDEEL